MSVSNFKPTIWHAALLVPYNKAHVFRALMNTDYEGDIKEKGNTVKINSIGDPSVKDYNRNAGLGGTGASPTVAEIDRPEILQGASMFLNITQEKYQSFGVDDVDKRQANAGLMAETMRRAAYQFSNTADLFCASTIQSGVAGTTDGTGNRLAAQTVGSGAGDYEAYKVLIDLGVKLDENNVPREGRWVAVPPWFLGLLALDDRFTNHGTPENRKNLRNGLMGETIDGMAVHVTNNLSGATSGTLAVPGGVHTVLAGVKSASTFAEQLNHPEAFRPDGSFSDAIKMLHVYGALVTRPTALASCAVTAA